MYSYVRCIFLYVYMNTERQKLLLRKKQSPGSWTICKGYLCIEKSYQSSPVLNIIPTEKITKINWVKTHLFNWFFIELCATNSFVATVKNTITQQRTALLVCLVLDFALWVNWNPPKRGGNHSYFKNHFFYFFF